MLKKLLLSVVAAVALVLAFPAEADAYRGGHVGYTHVGPAGVYHVGRTAVAGPRGVAVGGHTTAVGAGGGVYRGGYGGAAGYGGYHAGYGYGGYHPGYGYGGYGAGYGAYGFGGVGGYRYGSNYNANAAAAAANGAYR